MAGKPIYRGNKLNVMGVPRRMGQLTDDHIRDFYHLQARDGFAKEAIEELVRTEHKTREEIENICGIRRDKEMIDKETKAKLIADAANGMSCKQLAEKYQMTEKAVGYHLTEARKKGQIPLPKSAAKTKKKRTIHPEPGLPAGNSAEQPAAKNSTWFALLEALEKFALLAFGAGTAFDSCAASSEKKIARLGVLTPEGKKVQITIEEYNND